MNGTFITNNFLLFINQDTIRDREGEIREER